MVLSQLQGWDELQVYGNHMEASISAGSMATLGTPK